MSKESDHPVHFSFHVWSSPNHLVFFGMIGHWIDATGVLQCVLLGMEQFKEPHTGENQVYVIRALLQCYKLLHCVGYFTTVDASNNYTAMVALASYLSNEGISVDLVRQRIGCFGHIINLVVKAFLWG